VIVADRYPPTGHRGTAKRRQPDKNLSDALRRRNVKGTANASR
jgi:hypothetical protein